MTKLKFNGSGGLRPSAEARRYVYRVLAASIDEDLRDFDGWLLGGDRIRAGSSACARGGKARRRRAAPKGVNVIHDRRVIVCGSRDWTDEGAIRAELVKLPASTIIVHGAGPGRGPAPGADSIAGKVARSLGLAVEEHPADWDAHGNAAGPIRNQLMLDVAGDTLWFVLAFTWSLFREPQGVVWGTKARLSGTGDMTNRAVKAGRPVVVCPPPAPPHEPGKVELKTMAGEGLAVGVIVTQLGAEAQGYVISGQKLKIVRAKGGNC